MSKKKIGLILVLLVSFSSILHAAMAIPGIDDLKTPSIRSIKRNTEFTRPIKLKKITIAEYITDPFLLYLGLWGCFTASVPVWEFDSDRFFSTDQFQFRMALEPFTNNKIDEFTKVENGQAVLRTDFYAKNFLEPAFFTYFALYLRAKNYHPAIFVTEIVLLSVIYEFTVRPFYMNASFEQLLKNPGVGIVLAIFLDELSNFLLSTPHKGLHILGYLLNPFNALPNARIHPLLIFDPYKRAASIEAIIKL